MPRHSPYALYSLTCFGSLFQIELYEIILFPLKLLLLPLTFKKDLLLILLIAFALDISYISLQKYSVVNVH